MRPVFVPDGASLIPKDSNDNSIPTAPVASDITKDDHNPPTHMMFHESNPESMITAPNLATAPPTTN